MKTYKEIEELRERFDERFCNECNRCESQANANKPVNVAMPIEDWCGLCRTLTDVMHYVRAAGLSTDLDKEAEYYMNRIYEGLQ